MSSSFHIWVAAKTTGGGGAARGENHVFDIASRPVLAPPPRRASLPSVKIDDITKRPAQMTTAEVAKALAALDRGAADAQAIRARLAWRPAWAIRSRRGAAAAFLAMFRKG